MEVVLQAQIKNGLLYKAVQKCGTQGALAEYLEVSPITVGRWLRFMAVPDFRRPRSRYSATYEKWDTRLITLVGYGLEEIFPVELQTNQAAIQRAAKMEAVLDMPVDKLISAGAMPALAPMPSDGVVQEELKETIDKVLELLTPREEKVVQLRFGLHGNPPLTLEETADEFGVSRERIRQIEAKALRKLRHPEKSRQLKAFLEGPAIV